MNNYTNETKEYLIYVINKQAKVDGVYTAIKLVHDDGNDLEIVNQTSCSNGEWYVYHIKGCDAMFYEIKCSLRNLILWGICSKDDIRIVEDYHKEEDV